MGLRTQTTNVVPLVTNTKKWLIIPLEHMGIFPQETLQIKSFFHLFSFVQVARLISTQGLWIVWKCRAVTLHTLVSRSPTIAGARLQTLSLSCITRDWRKYVAFEMEVFTNNQKTAVFLAIFYYVFLTVVSTYIAWQIKKLRLNSWPEFASELHPSDRRLSAKFVPTFGDTGCHMVSATDPHGHILGFLVQQKLREN
jgi:hypothetical protein